MWGEVRMNDERARFLGRRQRRARSESSGFASLGQSQRDFEPHIPSLAGPRTKPSVGAGIFILFYWKTST
jgi:hypothetical protein